MATEISAVPFMSRSVGNDVELIDSAELAKRWQLPESWVRSRSRQRTAKHNRIPCVRFGRYVRFEWGSPELNRWLAAHRD